MGVAVFGEFSLTLIPTTGRAERRPKGRSQLPAKGPQRERKMVEMKFKKQTKWRERKEQKTRMKTVTQISRNSFLRISKRSRSQFVKGTQMTERGRYFNGTRTVFEFPYVMNTTYCRLETKTKSRKLQDKDSQQNFRTHGCTELCRPGWGGGMRPPPA